MKKNMLFALLFAILLSNSTVILSQDAPAPAAPTTMQTTATTEQTQDMPELPLEQKSSEPWSFSNFWKRLGYFFGFGEKTSYDIATEV